MKAMKTVAALLLIATIATTACAPKTPGRTTTSDSTGGTSPDTLMQQRSATDTSSMSGTDTSGMRRDSVQQQ